MRREGGWEGGGNALKCQGAAAMHLCQCGIHQAQLSPRKRGGGNSKDGFFNHVRTAGYVKQFQTNPSKRDIELTRPTEEKFCERDLGGRLLTPSKNEADGRRRRRGGGRREMGKRQRRAADAQRAAAAAASSFTSGARVHTHNSLFPLDSTIANQCSISQSHRRRRRCCNGRPL